MPSHAWALIRLFSHVDIPLAVGVLADGGKNFDQRADGRDECPEEQQAQDTGFRVAGVELMDA